MPLFSLAQRFFAGSARVSRHPRLTLASVSAMRKTATTKSTPAAPAAGSTLSDAEVITQHGMISPTGKVRTPRAAKADVLPTAQAIESAVKASKRTGKAVEVTPEPKAKAEPKPREPRPNSERRNEATHEDGRAAVDHGKCAKCGARKGELCLAGSGERTNYVHGPRFKAWEAAHAPAVTPAPAPRKAKAAPAPEKLAAVVTLTGRKAKAAK